MTLNAPVGTTKKSTDTRCFTWLNVPPGSPGPGQPRPEEAIGDLGGRSSGTPLVDGKLVTQREDLELEGGSRSEAGAERGDEGEEDCLHEGSKLTHLDGTKRELLELPHASDYGNSGTHSRRRSRRAASARTRARSPRAAYSWARRWRSSAVRVISYNAPRQGYRRGRPP
jgi:hypothetical protein